MKVGGACNSFQGIADTHTTNPATTRGKSFSVLNSFRVQKSVRRVKFLLFLQE